MTKYTMENGLLVPSRRGFMQVLAGAFTGAVVAPSIVPYSNLMQIDSLQNRLVVGYHSKFLFPSQVKPEWGFSLLNATDFIDSEKYAAWQAMCAENNYKLVRKAEIAYNPYDTPYFSKKGLKAHAESELNYALEMYRKSKQLIIG